MVEEKQCFAYGKNQCKILKEKKCEGCRFYKTKKEAESDRQKAIERIHSLDEKARSYVMEKYHGKKDSL